MKCATCGHENREGAKFCVECAQSLVDLAVCQRCKHVNPPSSKFCEQCAQPLINPASKTPVPSTPTSAASQPPSVPTSFASGRYVVKKFLGEGGKKKVYLAHDERLDRDVAFALIKTEKLDEAGRTRIKREAQAMARLDHPNVVSILDFGEHEGQPFMVLPLLSGGDVEGLIKKAPDHKLPVNQSIEIAASVLKGLEFAHSKGIIHRDIKPGNVWLSSDGTAKVGDFGLAVAVDLSRLTQDGMMVGTVSYMPPEQAMGGMVTNKADLYSLGAMLYEMVTGRPPFVGDDSVAIIGQHINTPPVSPTWHRSDLPPALETLILQLLEKDPSKRPATATVVLQALESIAAGKKVGLPADRASGKAEETQTTPQNPLYRRVFVGREPELKQLQAAFDGAISGQGALMMVLGEPGIGKTSLCEQLATYVTLRGGHTLVGHCYEEGSLSLPYLAFVEAMRSYVLTRDTKELRDELGAGAADVARIVSEIRERLKIRLRPQTDPEEDRYRLLQAVTGFLTSAAAVQPLVVVLEDLHDADKGTLEMLTHLSRKLAGARLLIIGTYRDVEVDRSHPLSAALAELRRVSSYGRVLLRGLNADEVRRMLESITGESVPWGLAEALHRQTEGNPLFVQEVIRYMAEEGLLVQKDGRWRPAKDTALEMNIPEGLRDVIGKRLSLLSPECNQLLSVASVIGREFALDTLKAVVSMDEESFMKALKEAVQLSVLEERSQVGSVRYRFTHAFFRQTLYEEMIAPQRLKMHRQVALALEKQYAKRLDEHAAELAEHFSQSTDPADLTKAVSYGEMAAKRSLDVYAYGEAVRLLQQALKVQKVLDPDDKGKICDLLLTLGETLNIAGEPRHALDVEFPEAFALAEAIGDRSRASRSCTAAIVGIAYYLGLNGFQSPESAQWAERADRYAGLETLARAWADFGLGIVRILRGNRTFESALLAEGAALLDHALEMVRRLKENEAFWFIGYYWLMINSAPQSTGKRWQLADEMGKRSPAGVTSKTQSMALRTLAGVYLESGHRELCDKCYADMKELAEHTGQANAVLLSLQTGVSRAIMDGRLEEIASIIRQVALRGQELGIPEYAGQVEFQSASQYHLFLGNTEETLRALSILPNVANTSGLRSLFLAYLGRQAEALEILQQRVILRSGFGTAEDNWPFVFDLQFLETSLILKNKRAVGMLLSRLAATGIRLSGGLGFIDCLEQYLGEAATLLGKYAEARMHFEEAAKVCTEMRFRPGLAMSRLDLAELLLEHYPSEKKEAIEHLDFAIKEFREMKMKPYLERALRHKDILKA